MTENGKTEELERKKEELGNICVPIEEESYNLNIINRKKNLNSNTKSDCQFYESMKSYKSLFETLYEKKDHNLSNLYFMDFRNLQ